MGDVEEGGCEAIKRIGGLLGCLQWKSFFCRQVEKISNFYVANFFDLFCKILIFSTNKSDLFDAFKLPFWSLWSHTTFTVDLFDPYTFNGWYIWSLQLPRLISLVLRNLTVDLFDSCNFHSWSLWYLQVSRLIPLIHATFTVDPFDSYNFHG